MIRVPLPLTAASAVVAGCAAVGMTFMLPAAAARDLAMITIPVVAALLTGVLVTGAHSTVRWMRRGSDVYSTAHPITGLVTTPVAARMLDVEFAAAQRGRPLTVVLFRIDQFPRFTAMHGQDIADRMLHASGRAVRRRTRGMNVAAHHGSDEATFLCVLSGVPLDGACIFARRLRKDLMTLPGGLRPPSVSTGVVAFDLSLASSQELIGRAERALDKASENGGAIMVMGRNDTGAGGGA